jgi:hypothetical protein
MSDQSFDLVEHFKATASQFMALWKEHRNAAQRDLEVQFFGVIDATNVAIVHEFPAHGAPPPQLRARILRHTVEHHRGLAGFFGAEAYMATGASRGDLPEDLADLPEDQRQECLIFSLSWPTGSITYRADVVDRVVGEWSEIPAGSGRLVDMLGAESRRPVEIDA